MPNWNHFLQQVVFPINKGVGGHGESTADEGVHDKFYRTESIRGESLLGYIGAVKPDILWYPCSGDNLSVLATGPWLKRTWASMRELPKEKPLLLWMNDIGFCDFPASNYFWEGAYESDHVAVSRALSANGERMIRWEHSDYPFTITWNSDAISFLLPNRDTRLGIHSSAFEVVLTDERVGESRQCLVFFSCADATVYFPSMLLQYDLPVTHMAFLKSSLTGTSRAGTVARLPSQLSTVGTLLSDHYCDEPKDAVPDGFVSIDNIPWDGRDLVVCKRIGV